MAEKTKEDKKDRILDAAIEAFAEFSYNLSKMSDIAKKAGVATGLIYFYFTNKLDLLLSVVIRFWDELIDNTNSTINTMSNPRDKLFAILDILRNQLTKNRTSLYLGKVLCENLPHILMIDEKHLQEKRRSIYEANRTFIIIIDKIIKEGQGSGQFNTELEAPLIRQILYGSIEMLIYGLFLKELRKEEVGYSRREAQDAMKFLLSRLLDLPERG